MQKTDYEMRIRDGISDVCSSDLSRPGINKAVLTLADGSRIQLDEINSGALTRQGDVEIIKSANGQLEYRSITSEGRIPREVAYNTLSTPRGGQFRIMLPDGTKVWLNAESSIRYPTVFAGNERPVSISGEEIGRAHV